MDSPPSDRRRRIDELTAHSPFVSELGRGESEIWSRLPAGAVKHVLQRQALCSPFLAADASEDYEQYVAAPTTGRMRPFINGRSWGGPDPRADQIEAFDSMQAAVEGLKSGESLFLAAWHFEPAVQLTRTDASGKNALGNRTWGELLQRKAKDGVRIRILMTDFDPITQGIHNLVRNRFLPDLDQLISVLGTKRDNLKYVVSRHPAVHTKVVARIPLRFHVGSHHQKFMVLRTGKGTVAYCGGLDIAYLRTPAYWKELHKQDYRWLWHDIHSRLEGLITRDLEREFVLRWNREKDHSVVPARPGWKPMEKLALAPPSKVDKAADRNKQTLQMWRTISVAGTPICTTRRDDIWRGYLQLIGCATQYLYMENQYYREPLMAEAIAKQLAAQPGLVVIIVVPSESDDKEDIVKKHGDSLQHRFFTRLLVDPVIKPRVRVYSMFHRIIHSKFIMADDRVLTIGSANANPRGFQLDAELNVTLDDEDGATAFRLRLWAHNLGLGPATVAGWRSSDFLARWDAVARANQSQRATPHRMTGEAIIPFDPLAKRGQRHPDVHDVETEVPG